MSRTWVVASGLFFTVITVLTLISPPVPNTVRIEFRAKDQGSVLQLFYLTQKKFNEKDSASRYYSPSNAVQTIFFTIPESAVQSLRLDPLSGTGEIGIKSLAVGYRPMQRFGPMLVGQVWQAKDIVSKFSASRNITVFRQEGDFARIVSAGNDPKLVSRPDDAFIAEWVSPLKIGFFGAWFVGIVKLFVLASGVALIRLLVKSSCTAFVRLNRSSGYLSACAIYTVAFCAAHFRLIFTQQMPIWDAQQYFHPYYVLLADYLRSGYLLFWNPYAAGGVPAYVDPQVAAFSPLTLLVGLITGGTTGGYMFYWLFLLWFGGAGILVLAKNLRAPLWGAVIAALGFSLSGFQTGHSEHLSFIYTVSFLPYVIYFISKGISENSMRHSAVGGVIIGIAGLGGYPGIVINLCVYAVVWMAGYSLLITREKHRWSAFALLGNISIFSVLALIVMAPTYFGFLYEGVGITSRVGSLSKVVAQSNPLSPGALISVTSPIFAILKSTFNLWPKTDISSVSIYAGSLTILLAVLSPFNKKNRGLVIGIACLSGVALAIAMGDATPLRGWVYDYFPPSRYSRHPSLFRIFYVFGMIYLSLYGSKVLQIIIEQRETSPLGYRWIRCANACVITVCIGACIGYLFYVFNYISAPLGYQLAHAHLLVSWGGPLLIAVLLSRFRRTLLQALPPLLILIAFLDALLNITISSPLISLPALRHVVPSHNIELTSKGFYREAGSDSNYNFLTKIPGFFAYCPLNSRNNFYNRIISNEHLFKLVTSSERVWLCENAVSIAPSEQNFLSLRGSPDFIDAFKCVVHSHEMMLGATEDSQDMQQDLSAFKPSIVQLSPTVEKYEPGHVVLSVDSQADGHLFFTDRWARSWRASVNGQQVRPLGGSFIFMSLKISKGKNNIELTYDPRYIKYLLTLSYGVAAFTLMMAIGCFLRNKGTERKPGTIDGSCV